MTECPDCGHDMDSDDKDTHFCGPAGSDLRTMPREVPNDLKREKAKMMED
jgi:Zn ribbon nucleic-acid-binding protein